MLALSRKKGDSIIVGDDVEIVVLGIQGEQVKLGIIAPRSISVHRKEVYIQIQNENKSAIQVSEDAVKQVKQLEQLLSGK